MVTLKPSTLHRSGGLLRFHGCVLCFATPNQCVGRPGRELCVQLQRGFQVFACFRSWVLIVHAFLSVFRASGLASDLGFRVWGVVGCRGHRVFRPEPPAWHWAWHLWTWTPQLPAAVTPLRPALSAVAGYKLLLVNFAHGNIPYYFIAQ